VVVSVPVAGVLAVPQLVSRVIASMVIRSAYCLRIISISNSMTVFCVLPWRQRGTTERYGTIHRLVSTCRTSQLHQQGLS